MTPFRHANFTIEYQDDTLVLIRDIGPWDMCPTITNDAEYVVERLASILQGRRLRYIDSKGDEDELFVKQILDWEDNPVSVEFAGFGD
jgi:hypothetical protein